MVLIRKKKPKINIIYKKIKIYIKYIKQEK